jgi:hypothetical protein
MIMRLNSQMLIKITSSVGITDFIAIRPINSISQHIMFNTAKIQSIYLLLTETLWSMPVITLPIEVTTHFGMLESLASFMLMSNTESKPMSGKQSTSFGYVGLDNQRLQTSKSVNPLININWIGLGL